MLEAVNLCFGDGQNMPSHCLNFSIRRGKILVVSGASGIGKSTLLNIIAGFLMPRSGNLLWDGDTLLPLPPWQRPISILFQQNNFFDHLSCQFNLQLAIHPSGRVTKQDSDKINLILKRLEIDHLAASLPHQLSGGQEQRMALARALIKEDVLILLDEPFSALDKTIKAEACALIQQLVAEQNIAMIVVTHEDEDIKSLRASNINLK